MFNFQLQEGTKEDEFEDRIFDEKQQRAILRAQLAKAEKKMMRRRAKMAKKESLEFLRRVSCEYRTDGHTFRKRTLSADVATKLDDNLQRSLVERRENGIAALERMDLESVITDEDRQSLDEVAIANIEIERQRKIREQMKLKKEQERKVCFLSTFTSGVLVFLPTFE